jgi:hypothetical protein
MGLSRLTRTSPPQTEPSRKKLRAVRVPSSRRVDKRVTLSYGEGLGGAIVDLSSSGLAFETPQLHGLRLGQSLEQVEVRFGADEVYCGPAVVCSLRNEGGRRVIGLSVGEGWLPVARAIDLDDRARLAEELEEEMRRLGRITDLPALLKASCADTRHFLEGLRRKLDEIDGRLRRLPLHGRERMERAALDSVAPVIAERLAYFARRLADIVGQRTLEEQDAYRRYVQTEVGLLLREAPLVRRVYEKPNGQPMDYEVLALAGRGAEGATLFARALEQFFCTVGPGRALALRTRELATLLCDEAARRAAAGVPTREPLRILAFGGGAAPELAALSAQRGIGRCELSILDGDPGALVHAQERLGGARDDGQARLEARFLQVNPLELLAEANAHEQLSAQDIIYVPTLLDVVGDRVAARMIATLCACLKPGGLLLCAALVRDDDTRCLFELVAEWFLAHRDEATLRRLVIGLSPGLDAGIQMGEQACNRYLAVRRRESDE